MSAAVSLPLSAAREQRSADHHHPTTADQHSSGLTSQVLLWALPSALTAYSRPYSHHHPLSSMLVGQVREHPMSTLCKHPLLNTLVNTLSVNTLCCEHPRL